MATTTVPNLYFGGVTHTIDNKTIETKTKGMEYDKDLRDDNYSFVSKCILFMQTSNSDKDAIEKDLRNGFNPFSSFVDFFGHFHVEFFKTTAMERIIGSQIEMPSSSSAHNFELFDLILQYFSRQQLLASLESIMKNSEYELWQTNFKTGFMSKLCLYLAKKHDCFERLYVMMKSHNTDVAEEFKISCHV